MIENNVLCILVSTFNKAAGTRCWATGGTNTKAADNLMTALDNDLSEAKQLLVEQGKSGNVRDFYQACMNIIAEHKTKPVQVPVAVPQQQSQLGILEAICAEIFSRMKTDELKATIGEQLKADAMDYIRAEYGPVKRRIEIETPERKVQLDGVQHEKFETILKFVSLDEPVFLEGPAGSGKNVICQQVAKALGLNFYFSNAVTQEYKLTGFTDANGTFHESQFYKAFKNGGLFMLDEMDASIPEVLVILNAAIANRYFDFPAPIGYVKAHKDFRVIAAGNTFGNGADYDYVGRNQLDAASLDRFAVVRVDYSAKIEETCANGDTALLDFCRAFRKACVDSGIHAIVSYRAINRMAKLSACMEAKEIIETCLVKGLELDSLNAIEKSLGACGKWSAGFKQLINERRA